MRCWRTVLFALLLLAFLISDVGLWLRGQQRQYALNRQLIAALVRTDDRQALALVEAGADPNTRYQPTSVPSLLDLVKQLFHRAKPAANDSPTALGMACGALWANDDANLRTQQGRPDAAQLVHVMLTHGADVTATMSSGWVEAGTGWTPFMFR